MDVQLKNALVGVATARHKYALADATVQRALSARNDANRQREAAEAELNRYVGSLVEQVAPKKGAA